MVCDPSSSLETLQINRHYTKLVSYPLFVLQHLKCKNQPYSKDHKKQTEKPGLDPQTLNLVATDLCLSFHPIHNIKEKLDIHQTEKQINTYLILQQDFISC